MELLKTVHAQGYDHERMARLHRVMKAMEKREMWFRLLSTTTFTWEKHCKTVRAQGYDHERKRACTSGGTLVVSRE